MADCGRDTFSNLKGWIAFRGKKLNKQIIGAERYNEWTFIDKRLHKFPDDEILVCDNNSLYFLDGFVLNKSELLKKHQTVSWEEAYIAEIKEQNSPKNLRGGFCGFVCDGNKCNFFGDHVGNRTIYYYCQEDCVVLSSRVQFIIELLHWHGIELTFNEQAMHYMLEHGFMIDRVTFANEISRVFPGEVISYSNDGTYNYCEYYRVDNAKINESISEEEAIELIDKYFREAVRREFEKDRENGYQYLTDLSGGLDSRMTAWVAHEMGYIDQVNFTYCRKDYLDFKIAQKLAHYLKHPFYYMMLDDFKWFCDIEELVKQNNGAAAFCGITGGKRFLQQLNCKMFGIEHTGMIGDAILSTFYSNEEYSYSKPTGHEKAYSDLKKYPIDNAVISRYRNVDDFAFNTRGLLGAQTSYFIRQNYVEVSSPFLDVDFLDVVFALPFKFRKNHYIYMKWIKKKYPEAAKFGWEKWYGVKPLWKNRKLRKIVKWMTKLKGVLECISGKPVRDNMNPMDFWMYENPEIKYWMDTYFEKNMGLLPLTDNIQEELKTMYRKTTSVSEREQVLTVIANAKNVLGM